MKLELKIYTREELCELLGIKVTTWSRNKSKYLQHLRTYADIEEIRDWRSFNYNVKEIYTEDHEIPKFGKRCQDKFLRDKMYDDTIKDLIKNGKDWWTFKILGQTLSQDKKIQQFKYKPNYNYKLTCERTKERYGRYKDEPPVESRHGIIDARGWCEETPEGLRPLTDQQNEKIRQTFKKYLKENNNLMDQYEAYEDEQDTELKLKLGQNVLDEIGISYQMALSEAAEWLGFMPVKGNHFLLDGEKLFNVFEGRPRSAD